MNTSIVIKKAEVKDAEAIHAIISEAFKKYVNDAGITVKIDALEETCEDIIRDINTKEVIIALSNGVPIGTIRVEIKDDNTAYISRFGVMPGYQNNGIGRALIAYVDNMLISKGIKKAYLYTASKHSELIRFYYSGGFYVESTSNDKGYIRALMVKEY